MSETKEHISLNEWVCLVCGKECPSEESLTYHCEEEHRCCFCHQQFENKTALHGHYNLEHTCVVCCDDQIPSLRELEEHYSSQHPLAKQCSICSKYFDSEIKLKNHRTTTHDCCFCDTVSATVVENETHMKTTHPRHKTCPFCRQKVENEQLYTQHLNQEHPNENKDDSDVELSTPVSLMSSPSKKEVWNVDDENIPVNPLWVEAAKRNASVINRKRKRFQDDDVVVVFFGKHSCPDCEQK